MFISISQTVSIKQYFSFTSSCNGLVAAVAAVVVYILTARVQLASQCCWGIFIPDQSRPGHCLLQLFICLFWPPTNCFSRQFHVLYVLNIDEYSSHITVLHKQNQFGGRCGYLMELGILGMVWCVVYWAVLHTVWGCTGYATVFPIVCIMWYVQGIVRGCILFRYCSYLVQCCMSWVYYSALFIGTTCY